MHLSARGGPEAIERLEAVLGGTALKRTGARAIARNTRAVLGDDDTSDLRLGEAQPPPEREDGAKDDHEPKVISFKRQ